MFLQQSSDDLTTVIKFKIKGFLFYITSQHQVEENPFTAVKGVYVNNGDARNAMYATQNMSILEIS